MNLFDFVHLIQCTALAYCISVPKGFHSLGKSGSDREQVCEPLLSINLVSLLYK